MKTATLLEIVQNVRYELGFADGFTQGVADVPATRYMVRRMQEQLYESFNWPHLIAEYDLTLSAGDKAYTFVAPMNRDKTFSFHVKYSEVWRPVDQGFDTTIYNSTMPEDTYREDPVRRWRILDDTQFEVWPTPASEQILRWRGIKPLPQLVNDGDVSALDANLLTLFVAAQMAARMKSAQAGVLNDQAQALFQRLKGQGMSHKPFVYGGATDNRSHEWQLRGRKI